MKHDCNEIVGLPAAFFDCFILNIRIHQMLRNVSDDLPVEIVSHPKRIDSKITPIKEKMSNHSKQN